MFGLFSIMVGILLIFLIFVMLAAARRTEMGMARAVGAKRSHLVQMFVFEGTTYDLMAAAVGDRAGPGCQLRHYRPAQLHHWAPGCGLLLHLLCTGHEHNRPPSAWA